MNGTPKVDRSRQCDGKVRHPDRRAARAARQRVRNLPDGEGTHLTIYRCPWCDAFHVGHAWADPYLADMAARAAARRSPELELELEAARAVAAVLGIPVDDALGYVLEPTELEWFDEAHHHAAGELEQLAPAGAAAGIMYLTTAELEEETDG